jgi:uncharacterized membrane protein HdeD (DUF308 family)
MANFFKKLTSRPMLVWKLGAGLLFIGIAAMFYFEPGTRDKASRTTTQLFSILLGLYGIYRLVTFYLDIKNMDDDE